MMKLPPASPALFALALLCYSSVHSSLHAQTLSSSKLSAHLINGYTPGGSNIVSGSPRTLKVLGSDTGFPAAMAQAFRDYKTRVPNGKVVVRIYSPKNYSLSNDATASATDFWNTILLQGLNYLSPSDRALIDYLEGPNEGQTPNLGNPGSAPLQGAQWFNQFWTNLTPLIVAAGYKPCIGSIAVGNPPGTIPQIQSYLAAFVPALLQAKAAGGAWSYHAYTVNYTTDLGTEIWYSLRYRQFYSFFAASYPALNSMPLILTEGGVDQTGDPTTSGWQARGSAADYQRWLNWFDQQLQQDPYLLGCTIFEIGNPQSWGWPSFDLEPIASWMGNYLITPVTVPPPPTGVTALPVPGSVTVSWTSPPLNPTSWTLKRSTNSAGPFLTIATNLTAGVRSISFTDTALGSSLSYYYVVTAVNAAGESPPSVPVLASFTAPSAINCGGGAVGSFQSDSFFDTGYTLSTATAINTNTVLNPAPMPVYQSQRYSNFTYNVAFLPPDTSYKVRLHFAEIYWSSIGQRVFNAFLNGVQVLANFDIIRAAGSPFTANIQEFNAISDSQGTISLRLANVVDNAALNGLELIPNPTNAIPPAPSNLAATVGNALVTLTWSVPAGATNFFVKRSTTSGGPYSVIASNFTQATYRDPSFVPNTTYYYVVSALNAAGESPNSLEVSARPTNGLPDLVVTSASWNPSSILSGTHVVFSTRVLNRGSAPTPSGIILGVGFNVDGAGTASWSGSYTTPLPPNSAITLTADGGPTGNYWTATPGSHTLFATVDDVNRIPESIEDNNAFTAPLNVVAANYWINCGGPAFGGFSADTLFTGSANTYTNTTSIDLTGTPNPAPAPIYQTERWGEFTYTLPSLFPGSNYTVRLHFAEIHPSVTNSGNRLFNVTVNGLQALTDFDVLAAAGAKFRALTRDIKRRTDNSGTLAIQFTRGSAGDPECNGIQVFTSALVPQPLISSLAVTNNTAALQWQSAAGGLYQVQYLDDLTQTSWNPSGAPILATGPITSATMPAANTQRFYRITLLNY